MGFLVQGKCLDYSFRYTSNICRYKVHCHLHSHHLATPPAQDLHIYNGIQLSEGSAEEEACKGCYHAKSAWS
jgi:hypothetical protein